MDPQPQSQLPERPEDRSRFCEGEDDRSRVLALWRGCDWVALEREMEDRAVRVGDLLPQLLRKLDLPRRRVEREIFHVWDKLIDPRIREHAHPAAIRQGTLYIQVDSSVWLAELHRFHRQEILRRLQEAFGPELIREVRFRLG